jgi:hypothetical protein
MLEGHRKKNKVSEVELEAEPPNHGTQQIIECFNMMDKGLAH